MHLSKTISVLFICLFKVCVCLLRNTHVVREIKIADVVTKLSANITFVNDGPEVANYYLFHLDYCAKDGYHIEIFQDDLNHLTYETVSDTNAKGEFENSEFKVYLPKEILSNDTGTLCINAYYTNCTVPHVTRKFADDQRFIHRSNVEYNSRYYTNYLETRLETAKIGILSTSKKPTRKTGNALYFVFQNIAPNSVNVVKIVFIDNNPHLIVEKLERQIDVSHFGRITVKERVYLENYGKCFSFSLDD